MENAEPADNMRMQSADKERLSDFESVVVKTEPKEEDGTETWEDTLTTAIEEHLVKVEMEEEQCDLIPSGLPVPDKEISDHEQPHHIGNYNTAHNTPKIHLFGVAFILKSLRGT
jgi:hypothetical protein